VWLPVVSWWYRGGGYRRVTEEEDGGECGGCTSFMVVGGPWLPWSPESIRGGEHDGARRNQGGEVLPANQGKKGGQVSSAEGAKVEVRTREQPAMAVIGWVVAARWWRAMAGARSRRWLSWKMAVT
jgi:hypothetical protein